MPAQCAGRTDRIALPFLARRSLVIGRDRTTLTSDAGLLVVRQFDERAGWTRRLAECFDDPRVAPEHSILSMVRQRVYGIVAGYEDCNDHDALRDDAVFKMVADRLPDGPALASQPTLSRFENGVSPRSILRAVDLMVGLGVERLARKHGGRVPDVVTIDADPTDDPTHGQQQLTFFHGFYDQHQYFPMVLSEPTTRHILVAWLRPGKVGAALGVEDDLERVAKSLRGSNPEARLHVRADAGVACPALYEWCDAGGHLFSCGIGPNSKLSGWAEGLARRAWERHARTGAKQRLFAVRRYRARTWKRDYRVVAKAECGPEGSNLRFMVTNAPVRTKAQAEASYDFYVRRGESEQRNEELKNGMSGDRLSCHRFRANFVRLLMHAMATNLLSALRDDPRVPHELRDAKPQTWRMRIVKVAARVVQTTRRVWLELSSSWPHWRLLRAVARRATACARAP